MNFFDEDNKSIFIKYQLTSRCLFNSLCDKQEVRLKHFCCIPKYNGYLKEEHLSNCLSYKYWTRCFFILEH